MRTLALSFAFLVLCAATTRAAEPNTCCVCQTGANGPGKAFFKLGCDVWLDSQKGCDLKTKVSSADQILSAVQSCQGGTVKLGYVGHWYGSDMTAQFARKYIAPLTDPNGLAASVDYDNTACSAMTNPLYVQEVIGQIAHAPDQHIRIKGIQTTSFGEWKHFVPKAYDISATVDTRDASPSFPSCAKIEGRRCAKLQESEQVVCDSGSEEAPQLKVLTCMKNMGNRFSRLLRPRRWEVETQNPSGFAGDFSCVHQGVAGFGDPDVGASIHGMIGQTPDGEVQIRAELDLPNAKDPSKPIQTTITGHIEPGTAGPYIRFSYFDQPSYSEMDLQIDSKGQDTDLILMTEDPKGNSHPINFGSCTLDQSP